MQNVDVESVLNKHGFSKEQLVVFYPGFLESYESIDAVYTVTVINKDKSFSSRCWGWYRNVSDAIDDVLKNKTDIQERYYDWCVIERFCEGICAVSCEEYWFMWNEEQGKWMPSTKPDFSKGIVGWGIG